MRGSAGVVALTCAVAACAVALPAFGSFPGVNGRIVFSSNRRADLQLQVFAVPAGGGVARNISRRPPFVNADAAVTRDGRLLFGSYPVNNAAGPGVWIVEGTGRRRLLVAGFAPAWSPDGKNVAYTSPDGDGLFVVPSRGGRARRVADTGYPGVWSPDGRWLAAGDGGGILVVGADGGQTRSLATGVLANTTPPSWAPDSRRLVVSDGAVTVLDVENGKSTPLVQGVDPVWSPVGDTIAFVRDGRIATVQADGSGARDVTTPPSGSADGRPAWSLDGARIAFVRRQPVLDATDSAVGVVDLSNRSERFVTPPADHFVDPYIRGLSWSPDGGTIYYASRSLRDVFHLFTVGPNLRNVRQLTRGAGSDRQPAWAPDGRRVAFVRNGDSLDVLDGARVRVVVRAQGLATPTWSPDGRRLAYAADGAVWTVGGTPRRVAAGSEPAWSPAGGWIAYVEGGIRLVHPDGTGDHWLKADDDEFVYSDPTWSPRADVLYYVASAPCHEGELWCGPGSGTVRALRPFARPVTEVRLPSFTGKPGVSPDGRFFVFPGLSRAPISGSGTFFGSASYATDVEPDWQRVRAPRRRPASRATSR